MSWYSCLQHSFPEPPLPQVLNLHFEWIEYKYNHGNEISLQQKTCEKRPVYHPEQPERDETTIKDNGGWVSLPIYVLGHCCYPKLLLIQIFIPPGPIVAS